MAIRSNAARKRRHLNELKGMYGWRKPGIAGPAFWVSGSGAGLRSRGEGNYSTRVSRAMHRLSALSYETRKVQ